MPCDVEGEAHPPSMEEATASTEMVNKLLEKKDLIEKFINVSVKLFSVFVNICHDLIDHVGR